MHTSASEGYIGVPARLVRKEELITCVHVRNLFVLVPYSSVQVVCRQVRTRVYRLITFSMKIAF